MTEDHLWTDNNPRPERRGPRPSVSVRVSFGSGGATPDVSPVGPIELTIEATSAAGELAGWLCDDWWTEVIGRWGDRACTVYVAPTPEALLHPVVLHQVEMLRRVLPEWRAVGYGFVEDLLGRDEIDQLLRSGYHELRLIDGRRPGVLKADRRLDGTTVEVLIGEIRREQTRRSVSTPVLVRVPGSTSDSTSPASAFQGRSAKIPLPQDS